MNDIALCLDPGSANAAQAAFYVREDSHVRLMDNCSRYDLRFPTLRKSNDG